MKMPQDFVDAANAAVLAVNPAANIMLSGSMTLGADFDEWLGPEAMLKYGIGPISAEVQKAFEAKFAEKREALKASVVASSVEVEKKRMAGELEYSFDDSYHDEKR
jgi:hypothetical protein